MIISAKCNCCICEDVCKYKEEYQKEVNRVKELCLNKSLIGLKIDCLKSKEVKFKQIKKQAGERETEYEGDNRSIEKMPE